MPLLTARRRWLLLTDAECEALKFALAYGRHPGVVTEAEVEILLDWANAARWGANTLAKVLLGEVGVDVREGMPYLIAPEEASREP